MAKTSKSSQDALFGPLLIVSTTLNLGLGITATAFELAATFVTEMSFSFEKVSPATSAIKFQVGARKEELCRSKINTFRDGASHLQCEVGTAVQHCGQEASFRAPTVTFPSSKLHEDDQVQSVSLESNEKVHFRRNPDISGKVACGVLLVVVLS